MAEWLPFKDMGIKIGDDGFKWFVTRGPSGRLYCTPYRADMTSNERMKRDFRMMSSEEIAEVGRQFELSNEEFQGLLRAF